MDLCNNHQWLIKPTGKRYGLYLNTMINFITTTSRTTGHYVPPDIIQQHPWSLVKQKHYTGI